MTSHIKNDPNNDDEKLRDSHKMAIFVADKFLTK